MPEQVLTNVVPEVAGQDIGLIGAGRMGTGMGISLMRHGAQLHIKPNANRIGADRLIGLGAHEYPSIAELATHAKIIILSLPSSHEVEAVCLGQDGLFANLSPNSLILDCTTAFPASTLALAEQAKRRGLRFVDAPVTRSPEHAEQGCLNAIVGADTETLSVAAGILAAFSESITHAGEVGQAHKLKLVYNSMTMGIAAVVAETCQLAGGLGVDLKTLRSLVSRGSTNSGIFQSIAAFLLEEKPDVLAISIVNAAKDIGYALDAANDIAIPTPVLTSAAQKLQAAIADGRGELTLPHLAQSVRPSFAAQPSANERKVDTLRP
jgi:3-hydroxyisobutyrate dehydrogenase-like beta-hydroxyacid dehydrogenase